MKKGFTLIEAVIYVAILAVVSVFAVNSVLLMIKTFGNYRVLRNLNTSGATAIERITREIRLADDVDGSSTFGTGLDHLILSTIDPFTENPTIIEFYASSSELMVKKGGGEEISLTPGNTELINLTFRELATTTNTISKAIKIEMELKSTRGNYQKTAKFYNTAVLRRSYGE